jgi:hypothetical protein
MVDDGTFFFLPSAVPEEEPGTEITHPLPGSPVRLELGERVIWRGRADLAEHLYSETMDRHSIRWTLPNPADIVVTDRRIAYASVDGPGTLYLASATHRPNQAVGHIRWHWPYHLYVCPGQSSPATAGGPGEGAQRGGRAAGLVHQQATRVLLVCGAAQAGGKPVLVLSGGDLDTVTAADALANVIRRAVAGYRLDNAAAIGLSPLHAQALSRRLVGPAFANRLDGPPQAVNLPGALLFGFRNSNEYRLAAAMTVAGLRAS